MVMKIKGGNAKLTFYDFTSNSCFTEGCLIDTNGFSIDNRQEKKQIIIAEVTTNDGFTIKNYVIEGGASNEGVVAEVVKDFRKSHRIEGATFIGEQGLRAKLDLDRIEREGFGYFREVKHHHDEMCKILFSEVEYPEVAYESY